MQDVNTSVLYAVQHDVISVLYAVQDDVTSVLAAGPAILAGSVDGTVRRFDIRMGRLYCDVLYHPVAALALSRDQLCVLAACLDSCLRLLDIQAGELLASYRGHSHASVRMGCAFTADDQHVVGCSEDGEGHRHPRRVRSSLGGGGRGKGGGVGGGR
jgi:mitogen-activated protein kinase organizer 1